MKIKDFKLFINICDMASLSKAARHLGTNQPAVSRSLAKLEQRLGSTLLFRTGHGVKPTRAGIQFYDFAVETVNAYQVLEAELRIMENRLPPDVSMAIPPGAGKLLIPVLMNAARKNFPETQLHVFEDHSPGIPEALRTGNRQIGLFFAPPSTISSTTDRIAIDTLCLVGRPSLIGASDNPISLQEVASIPMVLNDHRSVYAQRIRDAFASINAKFAPKAEIEMLDGLMHFILQGNVATILPYLLVYDLCARNELSARVIENPAISRTVLLNTSRDFRSGPAKKFLGVMRTTLINCRPEAGWLPAPNQ
jgi:DNA-binding transcriptional LysR family regulator